ncbi:predicted protein [Plenodomus lingam JN3]|uniref:Predicted protein n=1 Tax=Leptosphaeria maculans (strain JN3 / isolate v23.1.3 / race Av1-4-5-6-7-8) TaxID=985895 RepID=E4ZJT0_LEPMJ|nr:predicted protein [Plenodomus lingam JN3]CBX91365.1 predicted protein [Plenodomus lingam JN3]
MSTLRPSEAGHPCIQRDATTDHSQMTSELAFTPRSVLNSEMHVEDASPFSGDSTSRNCDIEFPLYSRATLPMEIVREEDRIPIAITRCLSGSDAGTVHGHLEEDQLAHAQSHNTGHAGQPSYSPRKSLPSHWLPKSSGPNLATAQRSKERSHKKDSQSGSPIQVKTIRGARSAIDFRKSYDIESPTYLTKEALAAVENDMSSPTSADGLHRLRRSPSKPSWRSPATSPLRSSPSQHTTNNMKMSPTRAGLLKAGSTSGSHSRAASSVTTSCKTFHTANESPVRSPSGTELSFHSASEYPEDAQIPHLKLDTDVELLQSHRRHDSTSPVKQQAATVGKTKYTKPRLALHIPITGFIGDSDSAASPLVILGSSTTNPRSSSPDLPRLPSRIPRGTATAKSGSAYSATQSSLLKRAQSVRSLATKSSIQNIPFNEPHQIPLPETPVASSLRQVRTVNSSGSTPILSRHSARETTKPSHGLAGSLNGYSSSEIDESDQLTRLALEPVCLSVAYTHDSSRLPNCDGTEPGSRATSSATVKALPLLAKPAPTDSSITYGRKKADSHGVTIGTNSYRHTSKLPTITVMMTDNPDLIADLGSLNIRNSIENFELPSSRIKSPTDSSTRGRTVRYVSEIRIQTESQHSLRSSGSSELRATAPEFVPRSIVDKPIQSNQNGLPQSASEPPDVIPTDVSDPPQFQPAPWFPLDMSGLDKHGIPWFYYMNPVQVAYDQGFRNGRSKSPRKFKHKKQRHSLSSPTDVHNCMPDQNLPPCKAITAAPPLATMGQRLSSSELMPPSPIPDHRRQQESNENMTQSSSESLTHRAETRNDQMNDRDVPFARQLDHIAQQDVLVNNTNIERPHGPRIDFRSIQNVTREQESRNPRYTNYHTMFTRHGRYHHRHAGNGLYNGRGSVGVPMFATTPFPDPAPPQGRPPLGPGGRPVVIGTEACGMIDVVFAAELGGGWPCNTCAPDH